MSLLPRLMINQILIAFLGYTTPFIRSIRAWGKPGRQYVAGLDGKEDMRPGMCRDTCFPFGLRRDAGSFVGMPADFLADYREVSLPGVTRLLRIATPQQYFVGCTRAKSKWIHCVP